MILTKSKLQNSLSILYLDDELSALENFSFQVSKYNAYEIEHLEIHARTISDHTEAILLLEKENYDAFVCDHNMPIKQGLDLIKYLKVDYPEVIYVLFTGAAFINSIVISECKKHEILYFTKAENFSTLIELIASKKSELNRRKDNSKTAGYSSIKNHLENVFVTEGLPKMTFVKPENFNNILLDIRHSKKPVIIEGQTGTGKTSTVKKIQEILYQQNPAENNFQYLSASKIKDLPTINSIAESPVYAKYIIDDFHRLPNEIKEKLANLACIATDEGEFSRFPKFVFIGINQTGQQLIQLASGVSKKCGIHKISTGSAKLISDLIQKGEVALNVQIVNHNEIFKEAGGDFWLTQVLCYATCIQNEVLETEDYPKKIKADIPGLRKIVIERLQSTYYYKVKDFCSGRYYRASNDFYFKFLKEISFSKKMPVNLVEMISYCTDDLKKIIGCIKDSRLSNHILNNQVLLDSFYYNVHTTTFHIEDPAMHYYLQHFNWDELYQEMGFKSGKICEFDAAISFAGENRVLAEFIANELAKEDLTIFYDKYYEAKYLGKTWSERFKTIFAYESKLVICLLDSNHKEKIWPTFERECFDERVKENEVVPIFLDNTAFVGIPKDLIGINFVFDVEDVNWKENAQIQIISKLLKRIDGL